MSFAADLRRKHERARRRQLDDLIARLRQSMGSSVELDAAQTLLALRVLEQVRAGRDPRPYYAIKPVTGPEPQNRGRDAWIAACFLKLREIEPEKLVKDHHIRIAKLTALSFRTVRDIIAKGPDSSATVSRGMTLETLEFMLKTITTALGSPGNTASK